MPKYIITNYDKYGKQIGKPFTENMSSSYGRWVQSKKYDERDGAKVRMYTALSSDQHNRVVTGYYAKNADGTKTTFKLQNQNLVIKKRPKGRKR